MTAHDSRLICISRGRQAGSISLCRCPRCLWFYGERKAGPGLDVFLRQFLTSEEIAECKKDAYRAPALRPTPIELVHELPPFSAKAKEAEAHWRSITEQEQRFGEWCEVHELVARFVSLVFHALAQVRTSRRYVRRHYYYDLRRGRPLRRVQESTETAKTVMFARMSSQYELYSQVIWAALFELWLTDARTSYVVRVKKALLSMKKVLNFRPMIEAGWMSSPDQSTQWAATCSVSGKLLSIIAPGRNPGLLNALDGAKGSPRQQLIEALPAATFLAWNLNPSGNSINDLRTRVLKGLKQNRPEPQLENRLSPVSYRKIIEDFGTRNPIDAGLERWREQQEAKRVFESLMARARLSSREHEVIMLIIHDDLALAEIGARLGISPGSVKKLKSRAMIKLQKAANL